MKVPAKIGQRLKCSDMPGCFLCGVKQIRKRGSSRSMVKMRFDGHSPHFFICLKCALAGSATAVQNQIKIKFLKLQEEANQ
jgi:hypothetical protein